MQHGGFQELEQRWGDVAQQDNRREAITIYRDDEAYERSGRQAANAVFDAIGSVPSIMDFGCGDGRITRHLAEIYKKVIAVDISQRMLREVNALKLPNVKCVRSNGTDLDVKVAAIFSDSVLMHNRKQDVYAIMRRFARCLPKDGYVVCQLPIYEKSSKSPEHWTDVGIWTPFEFFDLATESNLYVDKVWVNPGRFRWERIGPHHHRYHVLRKG